MCYFGIVLIVHIASITQESILSELADKGFWAFGEEKINYIAPRY